MNSWGSPGWIRSAHQTDQIAYVVQNRRTPRLAMPDLPSPKKAKAFQCQAITVSGLTTMSEQRQSAHTPLSQAQRSRSSGVNFGFFPNDAARRVGAGAQRFPTGERLEDRRQGDKQRG